MYAAGQRHRRRLEERSDAPTKAKQRRRTKRCTNEGKGEHLRQWEPVGAPTEAEERSDAPTKAEKKRCTNEGG